MKGYKKGYMAALGKVVSELDSHERYAEQGAAFSQYSVYRLHLDIIEKGEEWCDEDRKKKNKKKVR